MWLMSVFALLAWSGSDLFSKAGTRQGDTYSHYKVGIAVGLVMGIHAFILIFSGQVSITFSDILVYLPASLLYILSMLLGYIGLRYIELSISSPICNSSGALALLLSLLFFGVTWNPDDESGAIFLNGPIILGVVLIVAGIIALGIVEYRENDEARALRQQLSGRRYTKSVLAILLPVLYCLLDTLGTFVDTVIADNYSSALLEADPLLDSAVADSITGDVLNTAYELTWFLMAIVFAVYIFIIRREKPDKKYDGTKLLGGICETVGQVFYMMVVVSDFKVGLVIISAYCALSLVWSNLFLRERLSFRHWGAIASVLAGIVILGFYDV